MILEQQRLCVELQRLDWARTLSEEVIQELVAAAEAVQFQTGQTVLEYGAETQHIYFLISGRLAGGIFDRLGKEIYHDVLGRGAVLGLFSALLPDRSHLQVEALEPTLAIRLTLDQLLQLTSRHKEFQLAMFRVAANLV